MGKDLSMAIAGVPAALAPLLTVAPASAHLDEPGLMRVTGLAPAEQVSLTATMTDHSGRQWQSAATFTADSRGIIDVPTQAPIAGSYDGVEPMGLIWSMTLAVPGGSSLPF